MVKKEDLDNSIAPNNYVKQGKQKWVVWLRVDKKTNNDPTPLKSTYYSNKNKCTLVS